jgi:nucleoside phosphorylase
VLGISLIKMKNKIELLPEAYSVGWISAIRIEYEVAKAMLDKTHSPLTRQSLHDDSIYTLGSIGENNIVLALLAKQGTSTATGAAKDMMHMFHNIKFGLMVGIGGGIPGGWRDIRLGDVVVSIPDGPHGGVVQYDMGRKETDGLKRTGALNQPPKVLITAANELITTRTTSNDIDKYITQAWKNNTKDEEGAENEWRYPGANKDILFNSIFDHIDKNFDCSACAAEPKALFPRQPRPNPLPKIWVGNIALVIWS